MTLDELIKTLEKVRETIWAAGSLPVEIVQHGQDAYDIEVTSFEVVEEVRHFDTEPTRRIVRVIKLK